MSVECQIRPTLIGQQEIGATFKGCLLSQTEFVKAIEERERVSVPEGYPLLTVAYHCPSANDVLVFRECPFSGQATLVDWIDMKR